MKFCSNCGFKLEVKHEPKPIKELKDEAVILDPAHLGGLNEILTLQELVKKYPHFRIAQLRWMIFNEKQLKLDKVITRIGKRIYFHVPSFIEWFKTYKG